MFAAARAVVSIVLLALPAALLAQTGLSYPQVINAASTGKGKLGNGAVHRFDVPRIATARYAAYRTEQGEYVDAKVWKASAKALQEAANRCGNTPEPLFWQHTFRVLMDEAVPQ